MAPLNLELPSEEEIEKVYNLFKPFEWITDPMFFGMENIPEDKPVLFIGNHTFMGIWDASIMWFRLFHQKSIYTYSMVDHAHDKIPFWRDLAHTFGMVDGTKENCHQLLSSGRHMLIFPGGAREAFKHKGEKYQLIWKKRLGFARMAIEHGYTVIPFSAVGGEECYELVYDSEEVLKTPLGKVLKKLGVRKDLMLPVIKGVGFTPFPKPQRFYYKFGKPISTDVYKGENEDDHNAKDLKARIKFFVEEGIEELLEYRKKDPKRKLGNRLWKQITKKKKK